MNMVSYVYILISQKDGKRYIGSTDNLERRYKQHVDGLVPSTKNRRPLELKCFQEFNTLTEARLMESKYKKSRGLYEKAILNGTLRRFNGV